MSIKRGSTRQEHQSHYHLLMSETNQEPSVTGEPAGAPVPAPAVAAEGLVATTPSQPGGAKPPVQGCIDAHNAFIQYLNLPHCSFYNENISKLEASTCLKRENFAYLIFALLGLYLIAGSSAELLCNIIGLAYPAYASIMAVRTNYKFDDAQWLNYWTVFGFFTLIDFFAAGIMTFFPIYWLVKAIFLVYLYLPQTMGAQTIYIKVVDPLFKKIDELIEGKKTSSTIIKNKGL